MHPFVGTIATLAVAIIFYTWQLYHQIQQQRQRVLRQRVAYMLWVMAEELDEVPEELSAHGTA
jgi:recombinational DNA repair ATPase RecF